MMIRALLRKQLRELGAAFLRSSKTGKARSRASAMGYALLFAVLVVVLMLCFAGMALPLASVLLPAGLDWLYFASMGLTALLVSVLASAFTSYSGLFQSRDNELLLSLPIPPAVIFGVRVSVPVLSEQITEAEPSVSTECSFLTIALCMAMRCTPSASTTVRIAAKPSGTAATANETANSSESITS